MGVKRLSDDEAVSVRREARESGRAVVFTNGCFDALHAGHVHCLKTARRLGDLLIVGLNSDASVRRLKGPDRPVRSLQRRVEALSALPAVDHIVPFEEDTPEALLSALLPDVLVKGGDYSLNEVVGRDIVEGAGGRVDIIPLLPGYSTSASLEPSS